MFSLSFETVHIAHCLEETPVCDVFTLFSDSPYCSLFGGNPPVCDVFTLFCNSLYCSLFGRNPRLRCFHSLLKQSILLIVWRKPPSAMFSLSFLTVHIAHCLEETPLSAMFSLSFVTVYIAHCWSYVASKRYSTLQYRLTLCSASLRVHCKSSTCTLAVLHIGLFHFLSVQGDGRKKFKSIFALDFFDRNILSPGKQLGEFSVSLEFH